jgi:murein DD-endopeptidase MepM/ murein hydrolase activator NlpD
MKPKKLLILAAALIALAGVGFMAVYAYRILRTRPRSALAQQWLQDPSAHPQWAIQAGQRCGDAPFQFPTNGFVGYLWDDSWKIAHRHEGIDIFGGTQPNITPVYAAYDGYLTRRADWKSTVIIRIPSDPLHPGQQIWTYYTHMADPNGNSYIDSAFPAGTQEVFVKAGTLLGHQGDYSGDPNSPVGVHLHFSIVKDDGNGHILNELKITNTLDPSPYFNLSLNANRNAGEIPTCKITQP